MALTTIEISVRGKWFTVPAFYVHGKNIVVKGRLLKIAMIDAEEWLETEIDDPELCVQKLTAQRSGVLAADLFTFAQKLPATEPRYSYPMDWDSVAAVPTTSFKDWWDSVPQETRKNVRRAEKKGVSVQVRALDDDLIAGIAGVNNDCPVRQGVPYVHYGKSLDQVKKDQQSFLDRSDFVCAYHGDELIGFAKIVYRGDIASLLQILPKASQQDRRPANAIIAKAIELCGQKNVTHLTYGQFNYGNKRDNSLREFKMRNGFREILVPRYYVPLTVRGRLGMKIGLHRGLIGMLPHGAIMATVKTRAKWHELKHQYISRCSSIAEQPNRYRQTECAKPPAGSKISKEEQDSL
jgi:hypothetical protein